MQDHNRFPAPHATTHKRNGTDEILLDELGLPLDVTNLNASNTRHGLLLKLTDVTNMFLRADGQWAIPPSSGGGGGADATAWHNTGDAFGAEKKFGTTDAQNVSFVTSDIERMEIAALGAIYVTATTPGVGGVSNGSDGPGWSQAWVGNYNGELRTFIKNSNSGAATISSYRADNDGPIESDSIEHYTEFGIASTGFVTNIGGIVADEAFWIQSHCGINLVNYHNFPIRFSTAAIAAGTPRFGERMRILGVGGGIIMGNAPAGGYVLAGSEYLRVTDGGIRSEGNILVTTGDLTVSLGKIGIGTTPSAYLDILESVNGAVQAQVRNTNTGASAHAVISTTNDHAAAHNISFGHTGTGWTASTIFAADEGFMQSSGGVGINIQATGGYIRFTKWASSTLTEFARFTSGGKLGIGVGNTAPSNWVDVLDNANGGAVIQTKTSSNGNGALAYFNALNDSNNSLSLGMTGTGFTGAGGALGADTAFIQTVGSDLKLQVYTNNKLYFQTTHATRYQIDGDGKMAWFAAATVAQQTVGANVNNVASSGTTGQFDDFTNGTIYATDYPSLHNTIYQLCRSVAQLTTTLRNYGLAA